jgi:hypothetical protein
MQVASDLGTARHSGHLMVLGSAKRKNAVMKQGRGEPMKRSKKCDEKRCADATPFAALLIGRSCAANAHLILADAVKEKYTTPHDFALR